ncbi:MAG: PAS domain S-box protein [Steroidobacteraceae bacterium]|nr:PAS domain S-box protein [Steroidobacteraceae bacterium]
MASKHPQTTRGGAARDTRSRQGLEYRAILDAAVDAIIVIDHRGIIQEFSQAAQRVFGYTRDEIIGRNVNELMPEPYHSEHDGYLQRYVDSHEPHIIGIGREVRAKRKDGSLFACDLAVGEVQGMEPPRFVGFIRDITARKEAEEQLRRSEAELRLAQELANLGNYVMHTRAGEPDYFSPQLYRILGVQPGDASVAREEFIGKWVHGSDRKRVAGEFARMDAGKSALDIEYQVVLRDGTLKHLHHLAQAVFGPDGRVQKYVGTIHDITDRRHAEDEARVLQERLTHFSRLSTMGEMAAGLAHEINQPLSAIATYAQACQRLIRQPDHDVADVLAALEQINAQALRAGEVIRRLRNFVKNREVKREPVNCARLLEDLRTLAETDARLHNIRLRLDCQEPLPTVYADPIQLQQVVLNLVRNAIDAMSDAPEDRREVVLMTREVTDGEIEVTVADHGTGLAPEATEHLFNPFFTTKASGTGLGLAISRSIVRAHGGRLWHTPNDDCGVRFHFTLPVSPAVTTGE